MFGRFNIPADLIGAAGIERVTDREAREFLGVVRHGDMSGLIFPYFQPTGNERPCTFRLRRDNPEIEKGKPKNKYISPRGANRHLYFPPGAKELLANPNTVLVFVEAEKSSLTVLAWAARTGLDTHILPIAVGGVWGWRGRVGKTMNARGKRVDETGPLPDLTCVKNRQVRILFDSNSAQNHEVKRAQVAFDSTLREMGASAVINLDLPNGDWNGPDDYIAAAGDNAMLKVLEGQSTPESVSTSQGVGRESAATAIINLARSNAELIHFGEDSFATIRVSDHLETYSLRSRAFRSWLGQLFYREKRRAATGEALATAIGTLDGFARFECPERETFVRVAGSLEHVWIDLGDSQWRQVEVDASGWRVVDSCESHVRFRRAHGMLSLPLPDRGGSVNDLRKFVNVSGDDDFRLLAGFCIGALCPSGPYPILDLHGEQGSAKSTTTRAIRSVIDPNVAPLRSEPREARDLMIAANNGWMIPFDNISRLEPWLSDCLCRLSTGGGFSTRTLYSDSDETIFQAQRPVILNGIEELAVRGDLLDRCIVLDLPRIEDASRRDEHSFNEAFAVERGKIFGALLDAVSAAIGNRKSIILDGTPRMADFVRWVAAAEPTLGWGRREFLIAYRNNRRRANELALETPLAEAIRRIHLPWKGTATDLLKGLNAAVDEAVQGQKGWPVSGRALSNTLRRLAPNLRHAGVLIEFCDAFGKPLREPGTGRRLIALSENSRNSTSHTSEGSQTSKTQLAETTEVTNSCDESSECDAEKHSLSGVCPEPEEGEL